MSDDLLSEVENTGRVSRPSLVQVRAVIDFMQKHPELAHRRLRSGMSHEKFKKHWIELSNTLNSLNGAMKSTKGWIKFWSDKKRSVILKQKQIDEGKLHGRLASIEQKILDLCGEYRNIGSRRKKSVKKELYDGEDSMDEDNFSKNGDELEFSQMDSDRLFSAEAEERQMNMMEKLVEVMDQQASAMTQMAQASINNAKALERIAEASHIQALAVDRLVGTFENISGPIHDVRNAIMNIDYTMKRCYNVTTTQRQNSNIFS